MASMQADVRNEVQYLIKSKNDRGQQEYEEDKAVLSGITSKKDDAQLLEG